MLKRRDLNDSHTLGYEGRNKIKSSSGSTVHAGGTSPGQTWKKPKDLSTHEGNKKVRSVCVCAETSEIVVDDVDFQ